jgi:L-aspartate oxidase
MSMAQEFFPTGATPFRPARDERLGAEGDVVIVGAGLAGLFTALKLAPIPVTLVAAAPLGQGSSTGWAQGGVAAAVGSNDEPALHADDTVTAGAGIVDPNVARFVAAEGPDRIADLVAFGVPFDRDAGGAFALSQEAAHSRRRVVHVSGDRTGAAILDALIARVRATSSIRVLEGYEADELIMADDRVEGVRLVRTAAHGKEVYEYFPACAVVLATGVPVPSSATRNSCSSTRPQLTSDSIRRRWPPRRCAVKARRSSMQAASGS